MEKSVLQVMKLPLGSLPFLATALWSAVLYFRTQESSRSWRWSLAKGCVILGSFSLAVTELLSALHLLFLSPAAVAWALFTALPLFLLYQRRRGIDPTAEFVRLESKISGLPIWALGVLTGTGLLIILMGVATPPMNDDVQIYHLPRQIYWMMQGSIEPFAASHTHQISMPVLSEFLGLNLLILSGSDAWHNLVQMLFLLASGGVVTLMTKSLGGSPRGQSFSLLFVVLVPVLFLEASNAKNDIILSLFILLPLLIGIRIWTGEAAASVPILLLAALEAGLALATKGTAIAYLVAPALLIVAACIRSKEPRVLLQAMLPALLLAILPASPQLMRNWVVFHSLAGPNLHHSNLRHDPVSIAGVAVRNIAGQFTCGSEAWNQLLEIKTRAALALFGVSADDPQTTFEGQQFHLSYLAGLEDIAPAPVQTIFLLLLPFGFFLTSFRESRGVLVLFAATALSLLLFCFLFRWQPWQGRLFIPAYFMAAPLIGILGDLARPYWLPLAVTLLELLTLRPHLLYAGQRPLFGGESIFRTSKDAQMSRMMPGRAQEIEALTSYLKQQGASRIIIDGGTTEIYGILRGMHQGLPEAALLSGHADQPGDADAVIMPVLKDAGVPPPPADLNPQEPPHFKAAWLGDYYRVFLPEQKGLPKEVTAHFSGFDPTENLSEPRFFGGSLRHWGRELTSQNIQFHVRVSSPSELQLILRGKPGTHVVIRWNDTILVDENLKTDSLVISEPVAPSIQPEGSLTLKATDPFLWIERLTVIPR